MTNNTELQALKEQIEIQKLQNELAALKGATATPAAAPTATTIAPVPTTEVLPPVVRSVGKAGGGEQVGAAVLGLCTAGPIGAVAAWGVIKLFGGKWLPWMMTGVVAAPVLAITQLGAVGGIGLGALFNAADSYEAPVETVRTAPTGRINSAPTYTPTVVPTYTPTVEGQANKAGDAVFTNADGETTTYTYTSQYRGAASYLVTYSDGLKVSYEIYPSGNGFVRTKDSKGYFTEVTSTTWSQTTDNTITIVSEEGSVTTLFGFTLSTDRD